MRMQTAVSVVSGLIALAGAAGARAQCVPATVGLVQPTASWSQPCGGSYRPGNVVDADPLTSWALGRCNGAADETLTESLVFETAADIVGLGASLELSIFSGRYEACCGGGMNTVGRFRVWVTDGSRGDFANGAVTGGQIGSAWTLLVPDAVATWAADAYGVVQASGQPTATVLEGGIIEISGANPAYATYTVAARSPLERVTGVRIELVNAANPPAGGFKGPGRHSNGNCEVRTVGLRASTPPVIETPPADQYVCPGGAASFYCQASGAGPIRYQWRRDGRVIRGATGPTFVVPAATAATVGEYDCVVTGACGTTTSPSARLVSCPADFNCDQFLDFFDYEAFVECFEGGQCPGSFNADFNGDGFVDFFDYDAFLMGFEEGC